MDRMTRSSSNPIITIKDVIPTSPELKVIGIFNCGAVRCKKEIILLCRVAETVKTKMTGKVQIPMLSEESGFNRIEIDELSIDESLCDFRDSRSIRLKDSGKIERLTSISHLRIARSSDGISFKVDPEPFIMPMGQSEEWGIEDPRITHLDGEYQITYSSICRSGVTVSLITTPDFRSFIRKGIILPPTNKDAAIFPEKIENDYYMLHRPVPSEIGGLNIWIAQSDNLVNWGNHRCIYESGRGGAWEADRVGVGTPPLLTEKGWLLFYHGADSASRYSAGLLLLDRKNPCRIIAESSAPVIIPLERYETEGFFPNVVFPCGVVENDDELQVYYGAADDKICTATISWSSIWEALDV